MAFIQKIKSEIKVHFGMWQCSNTIFKDSCGCTVLDMLDVRESTEQMDWRVKQPSRVAFVSKDL